VSPSLFSLGSVRFKFKVSAWLPIALSEFRYIGRVRREVSEREIQHRNAIQKDLPDEVEKVLMQLEQHITTHHSSILAEFHNMDKDNSGSVTTQELANIMSEYGVHLDWNGWCRMMKELDDNHDGEVGYDELLSSLRAWRSRRIEKMRLSPRRKGKVREPVMPPSDVPNKNLNDCLLDHYPPDQELRENIAGWMDQELAATCPDATCAGQDSHVLRLQLNPNPNANPNPNPSTNPNPSPTCR